MQRAFVIEGGFESWFPQHLLQIIDVALMKIFPHPTVYFHAKDMTTNYPWCYFTLEARTTCESNLY